MLKYILVLVYLVTIHSVKLRLRSKVTNPELYRPMKGNFIDLTQKPYVVNNNF